MPEHSGFALKSIVIPEFALHAADVFGQVAAVYCPGLFQFFFCGIYKATLLSTYANIRIINTGKLAGSILTLCRYNENVLSGKSHSEMNVPPYRKYVADVVDYHILVQCDGCHEAGVS